MQSRHYPIMQTKTGVEIKEVCRFGARRELAKDNV